MTKDRLKSYYKQLSNLKYSEENIAELYLIINNLIDFLTSIEPDRKKNKCLHFVLLTKEREFEYFKRANKKDWKINFESTKSSLEHDLYMYCFEFWDPLEDLKNGKL